MSAPAATRTPAGIGESPIRPDATLKVTGEFAYSSDLWHDEALFGVTLRSPHPRARITGIDVSGALAVAGVYAVLTHDDVPGAPYYGLDEPDQPVLAIDEVRFQGEPVAILAAADPFTARRALGQIRVEYDPLPPLTDAVRAVMDPAAPWVHPHGNIVRHQPIRFGRPDQVSAAVVVTGEYHTGMQDQASLGPESGLAVPAVDGGIDLYVSTQWLHADRAQIAPCLGLPEDKVRITLAGVGGAFGSREDISMQVHACLLALHTGRPVRMVYGREESFLGHVHRHPATLRYEHGADVDGRLVYVKATIVLDGGAYASTTRAVVGNAATLGVGPYEVPHVAIDVYGARTNNPPCGAMRGFGAVQTCFAYESQMDALAAKLGLDPVEIRVRNAVSQGSRLPTGQVIDSPAPLAHMLRRLEAMPLPAALALVGPPASAVDTTSLPGGTGGTTRVEHVRRGIGYGVGIKNICFSEGFDDYATATVRLEVVAGEPVASVHTAAAEVGQGVVTLQAQIVRTELGVRTVTVRPADTSIGSAGSSSASRQSYMTGGAVKAACDAVRARIADRLQWPASDVELADGSVLAGGEGVALVQVLADEAIEETAVFRHRPTTALDPVTGQGDSHVQFALCVHRAVVNVDQELGLVKVVELAAVQDVGRIMNRVALEGQIHGGTAQGLGLALMEQLQVMDGRVGNPSFTDYLIPTAADMPPMQLEILEYADPNAPYGLRGAGEPPTLSSTPAIVAAVRDATGLALRQVPIRPEHLCLPLP
jgi:xanthine dehydrogenase D subunit